MEKINIQNLDLYFNHDERFKTVSLAIYFYLPFEKKYLAENAIITQLIQKTNQIYDNEVDFSYQLRSMYDMSFSATSTIIGKVQVFRLSVSFVNPKYISDNIDIIHEASLFLFNALFKPSFTKEKLDLEKQIFIKSFESIYNNKTKYAIKRFNEIMFKDEIERLNQNGDDETIKKVTIKSLKDAYKRIITSPCYLFATGNLDQALIVNDLNKYQLSKLVPYQLNSSLEFIDNYNKEIIKINEVTEEQNINQTIVCFGLRSRIRRNSKYRFALNIFSGMLGEYFHSTLFQIIREEKSLAYSVSSDVLISKGVLNIFAKISSKNIDLVKEIVKNEIKKYQAGDISEEVLELTKKAKINMVLKNGDSPFNPLYDLQEKLMGFGEINDQIIIQEFEKITIADIQEVANMFKFDTIYVLKGNL